MPQVLSASWRYQGWQRTPGPWLLWLGPEQPPQPGLRQERLRAWGSLSSARCTPVACHPPGPGPGSQHSGLQGQCCQPLITDPDHASLPGKLLAAAASSALREKFLLSSVTETEVRPAMQQMGTDGRSFQDHLIPISQVSRLREEDRWWVGPQLASSELSQLPLALRTADQEPQTAGDP